MPKVLLTSCCRPYGVDGDAPSVGYELLFGQVTRAQGLFSPRALHLYFGLEYIAENLDAPTVVLQYPSRQELIRELRREKYDYIGVSFILAVFHKMKDVVAIIREHSPHSKIVLGGYGTVLDDETLKPYGDYICREEGVAFFRDLLGETPRAMPYRHPLIVSRLKLFSLPVSKTGMVFAGLGCPNGCDFCCTSHFFSRRHIRLLPTGKDIYDVVERYLDIDPKMSIVILDEDFLLNKKRAMEFRERVLKGGREVSMFVFSSLRAISQYTTQEILEMGIDGFWIGYEGTRSGYAKQGGKTPEQLFPELRKNGVTILASMIVGFDYQTEEIVAQELDGLLKLDPCLAQFLIYGPTPGTPFYKRILAENRLHQKLVDKPEDFYRSCAGFEAMVKHPGLTPEQIRGLQKWCFEEDFRRLGPSIYRVTERYLNGYLAHKDSPVPFLRLKAERFARELRAAYPSFLVGMLFGPTKAARARVRALARGAYAALGRPTLAERAMSLAALGAAGWTSLTLRLKWFQHPKLTRTAYRCPEPASSAAWSELARSFETRGIRLTAELERARAAVRVRLEGRLAATHAEELSKELSDAVASMRGKIVLDLRRMRWEPHAMPHVAWSLRRHRRRLKVVLDRRMKAEPDARLLLALTAS